jgi:MazG family protein
LDELVHRLRAECPWDQKQSHGSLASHLLEETYETLDAIEALSSSEPEVAPALVAHLEEELGDLLFQVYFHAVLAEEEGRFTLADVARGVHEKLVSRHPHVFGDTVAATADAVAANWEVLKKKEKGRSSVTEGIPRALPALALATKLQKKAGSVGLDGPGLGARRAEVVALITGLEAGGDGPELDRAVGEVLFAVAEMARMVGVDPETALRARTVAFRREIEAAEAGSPAG